VRRTNTRAEMFWFGVVSVIWGLLSVAFAFGGVVMGRSTPHFDALEILIGAAAALGLWIGGMKLVEVLGDRGRRIRILEGHQADAIAQAREFEAREAIHAKQVEAQEQTIEELREALRDAQHEGDFVAEELRAQLGELRRKGGLDRPALRVTRST
jgi:uncharacterized coiled-coil protein SlyX